MLNAVVTYRPRVYLDCPSGKEAAAVARVRAACEGAGFDVTEIMGRAGIVEPGRAWGSSSEDSRRRGASEDKRRGGRGGGDGLGGRSAFLARDFDEDAWLDDDEGGEFQSPQGYCRQRTQM